MILPFPTHDSRIQGELMVDSSITYKILCPTNSLKVIVVNKNTYINLIMHSLKHS